MTTMCWMGEPGIGETVLAGTGGEGVKAMFALQPVKAATAHAPPHIIASRRSPFPGFACLAARGFLVLYDMTGLCPQAPR